MEDWRTSPEFFLWSLRREFDSFEEGWIPFLRIGEAVATEVIFLHNTLFHRWFVFLRRERRICVGRDDYSVFVSSRSGLRRKSFAPFLCGCLRDEWFASYSLMLHTAQIRNDGRSPFRGALWCKTCKSISIQMQIWLKVIKGYLAPMIHITANLT